MDSKHIAHIGLMVAFIIVLGFIPPIPLFILPTPIIIQNIGIMMAGLFLGKKNGTMSVLLFLFIAAIGFPVLSGFHGGFAVFIGSTGGYLISYPFAAYLIGWGSEKLSTGKKDKMLYFCLLFVIGVLFIDVVGAIGMTFLGNVPLSKSFIGSLLFIPGDTIKAFLVVLLYYGLPKSIVQNLS